MECREYVNNEIKKQTTYIDAKSFIQGARPMRRIKIIMWIIAFVLALINIGIGILAALVVAFIAPMFIASFRLLKMNAIKYQVGSVKPVNVDDLCAFLSENFTEYFTEWQRGNPAIFGRVAENERVIECCFKNKTYHRIVFMIGHEGEYQIMGSHITTKERIKRASRGTTLIYKHHYVVAPIIKAAMDFYFSLER